jgi:hypothetical protein
LTRPDLYPGTARCNQVLEYSSSHAIHGID